MWPPSTSASLAYLAALSEVVSLLFSAWCLGLLTPKTAIRNAEHQLYHTTTERYPE